MEFRLDYEPLGCAVANHPRYYLIGISGRYSDTFSVLAQDGLQEVCEKLMRDMRIGEQQS